MFFGKDIIIQANQKFAVKGEMKMAVYKKEYFGIARKIVSNMTCESWEQIPHTAMGYEADVTEFLAELKKINASIENKEDKITVNTAIMKVICEGLKSAPKMNCTLDFRRKLVRGTLNYNDTIDISMPMILKSGEMMTVNLHDMGNKSLTEFAAQIKDTIRRANNSIWMKRCIRYLLITRWKV